MTFGWGEFLVVAGESQRCPSLASVAEARDRVIVSRAYYAAFNTALRHFSDTGFYRRAERKGDDHTLLPQDLLRHRDKAVQNVGSILDELRRARHWADYETGGPPQKNQCVRASAAIYKANLAIKLVGELASQP